MRPAPLLSGPFKLLLHPPLLELCLVLLWHRADVSEPYLFKPMDERVLIPLSEGLQTGAEYRLEVHVESDDQNKQKGNRAHVNGNHCVRHP
jgi:hypothetical protein